MLLHRENLGGMIFHPVQISQSDILLFIYSSTILALTTPGTSFSFFMISSDAI